MSSAPFARCAAIALGLSLTLPGVGVARTAGPGLHFAEAALEPSAWNRLDAWAADDHAAAYATFVKSCRALVGEKEAAPASRRFVAAMKAVCRRALVAPRLSEEDARAFFEKHFEPLHIAKLGDAEGF